MEITIYKLFQSFAGAETGRNCRSCGEAINRRDAFGMSESVCIACRVAAGS